MPDRPLVSVIIPNWNGARLLPTCLQSVSRQTRSDFETIVVDDASTDDSRELLARDYPWVRLLALAANLGFAAAVNAGIRAARGEIIVLLNNDTEADPLWLEELVRPLQVDPACAIVASKLRLFADRDKLHSAGDFYGVDGVPGNRGVWQVDRGQFDSPESLPPVFGACAGAAAYRRSLFDAIGLFDEALGSYLEDVDLNWRARLAGYRCAFAPRAVVYHMVSATAGGPRASYFVGRNLILVLVKDYPVGLWSKYWPRILGAQLRITWEALCHWRGPAARARLRGQLAALASFARFLGVRKNVQAIRRVSDQELERALAK